MEEKLVALKLFLDALDVPAEIASVEDRKRVQKAVYLGQLSGVDLGYRFGWYLMGPYSTRLTVDYYELAQELKQGTDTLSDKHLKPDAVEKISAIRPLLQKPDDFARPDSDWLELLASYHYLRSVSRKNRSEAIETLNTQKPHVAPYVGIAERTLRESGFLK